MLIIQSRRQGIFNRMYTIFAQYIWYIAIGLLIAIFTEIYPKNILSNLITVLSLIIVFSAWLAIFNSGESKIIEHGLAIDDQGITYISYGDKVTIEWSNFIGFNVKNSFPRLVSLKSSTSKNIEFSYYMFSSTQRRELFGCLAEK